MSEEELKEYCKSASLEISNMQHTIERLQQENKILRENAEHNDKVVDKVNWENNLLKQENQQLKEENSNYRRLGFKHLQQQNNLYQSVIDEVQHILNNQIDYREFVDVVNAIEEVLDKANIKESNKDVD